tara:strand:+ start:374 stop:2311 length:1938 start_codon:yes stop_codon:yes gene_type:complete
MRGKTSLNEEIERMKGLIVYQNGDYKNPILKEQKENPLPTFTKKVDFGPGWYTLKGEHSGTKWDIPESLSKELNTVKEFLIKNPEGYITNVKIEAGESKIPNTDNTGALGKYPNNKVKPKYLSNKRSETIKNYVEKVFDTWKKEGLIKSEINVIIEDPIIGGPEWVGKDGLTDQQEFCPKNQRANDPEGYKCGPKYREGLRNNKYTQLRNDYTDAQYVKVIINVNKDISIGGGEEKIEPVTEYEGGITPIPVTEGCLSGLKIKILTKSHSCNKAEFFIVANNTVLKNTDGGITHNGNDGEGNSITLDNAGVKLNKFASNPGYGYLGTTKYGTKGHLKKDGKGERFDDFAITPEQSKQIISQTKNNALVIYAICTTQVCHSDMVTATIYHPKREKNVFGPKVLKADSNILAILSPCGDAITTTESKGTLLNLFKKPDISTTISKFEASRISISNKTGGLATSKNKLGDSKIEIPYKDILLNRLNLMENSVDKMIDDIEAIFIKYGNVYKDRTEEYKKKKFGYYFKNYLNGKGDDIFEKIVKNVRNTNPALFGGETSNEKKVDFKIGDRKFQIWDKNLSKDEEEMFNDVKRKLSKIYTVLNQIITSNSLIDQFQGNDHLRLEPQPIDKVYNIFKGRAKRVGDVVQNF